MKTVGRRREPDIVEHASADLLAEGARFNEAVAKLSPTTFVPKGLYRFRSHDEANRHELECLARGMARLAAERANARERALQVLRSGKGRDPGGDPP